MSATNFKMNNRLMDYVLSYQIPNRNYLLHVTFWSYSDFNRLSSAQFEALDNELLLSDLIAMLISVEDTILTCGTANFLGYSNQCTLTGFLDFNNSKIVTIQFNQLYPSPDTARFPHILNVEIFVCNKETDFMSIHQNTSFHNGSSTTFHLL